MGITLKQKDIWDYIADLSNRVNRLETGGKRFVEMAPVATANFTLLSNDYLSLIATVNWDDPNVTANPNGKIFFTFYIDNDNNANYKWPDGASIDPTETLVFWNYNWFDSNADNFTKTNVDFLLWNLGAGTHTMYIHMAFSAMSGQTGAGGA